VVNLSRGTGGRRHAIRVVSDAENGAAWLSVGDFQSEADADAKAKDREETKRLLYVALTRARDRLYLASEVKDARWRAFGGSLGDILPAGIKARFEVAGTAPAPDTTEWSAASGHVHTFRVCSTQRREAQRILWKEFLLRVSAPLRRDPSDLQTTSLRSSIPFELPRVAVTRAFAPEVERRRKNQIDTSCRSLTGTLVHRLFERFGTSLAGDGPERSIASELARLNRDEESVEAGDIEDVFEHARDAYLGLCAQAELSDALDSGAPLFEVPFSVRPASSQLILRGTFDCLIHRRDGGITVLELKTGKRAAEHDLQLEMYVTAAKAMYPGMPVEGRLVYAHGGSG
jgi:ATP-dependent exoDNAse (exonuclease V) beta subunit